MSHNHYGPAHYPPTGPPHGPPPPYYPPPGAYGYVPAGVMPMYPVMMPGTTIDQPTYVTNHIYQPHQPTEQVMVAEQHHVFHRPPPVHLDQSQAMKIEITWAPATPNTAAEFGTHAVKAGHEGWDGSPLWVIRAHHAGELVPGKLAVKHRAAYVPHAGKEVPVHNFEVLCVPEGVCRWVVASNGQVPTGAVVAGNTVNAEPLYVGRARHQLSLTPGKVHPSHGCCYISFGGAEIAYKNYEILCKM